MNDISTKIEKREWLEILLAIGVLIIASLLPSTIALIITSVFFAVFAFIKPFQALVVLVPYVIFRTFFTEINSGMGLVGDLITFVVLCRLLINNLNNWKSWFYFKPFEWFFFVFLLFGAIIGLKNGVTVTSVIFQIRTFVIMYLLYYIISRSMLPKNFLVKLAWITVASSAILFVHGVIEKMWARQLLLPLDWSQKVLSSTNVVRIYGLVNNPNSLALTMFFAITATLFLRWIYQNEQYKVTLLISQVAFTGLLILTLSRGTWIAAFVFVCFFILFTQNWKLVKQLALTLVAAVLLVYYPVNLGIGLVQKLGLEYTGNSSGVGNRLAETFDEETLALMSESGRVFYIKKGFEVLRDYPITGAGFGTFGGSATLSYDSPIYKKYGIRSDIYGGKNFYSDNQYIQIIAETGAVGVVLFAGFLLTMVWMMWREKYSQYAKYMVALWFATGVAGFFYNIWELKLYTMFFFILFGIFVSYKKMYPSLQLDTVNHHYWR